MTETQNTKQYDLEERTLKFADRVKEFIKKIPKSLASYEYSKQLIRSSGSIGANYIEANESLSTKEFIYRIHICRKESKESRYWLKLVDAGDGENLSKKNELIQEALELTKIFGSILEKYK